jgi:hypothetical protein
MDSRLCGNDKSLLHSHQVVVGQLLRSPARAKVGNSVALYRSDAR